MKSYGLRDDIDYVAINLSDNGFDGPDTAFINAIFKDDDYSKAYEIVKKLQSNLELVDEEEVYINRWFSFLISLYKKEMINMYLLDILQMKIQEQKMKHGTNII